MPDKWKDFPHHHGKATVTADYIQRARRFFLNDNLGDACYCLGIALHYVQDYYTSLSARSQKHQNWEEQMDKAYFNNNLRVLVERAFPEGDRRRGMYTWYVDVFSRGVEGRNATIKLATLEGPGFVNRRYRIWGKPYVDVNLALKASSLIVKSVFSPKTSMQLNKKLENLAEECKMKMQESENGSVDFLLELSKRKRDLKNKRKKNGLLQRIKGLILALQIRKTMLQMDSALKKYKDRVHLRKVLSDYEVTVERLTLPNSDWYLFNVPIIGLGCVEEK